MGIKIEKPAAVMDPGPPVTDAFVDGWHGHDPNATSPSSYTLIDNFDKFDLATYSRYISISTVTETTAPLMRSVIQNLETVEIPNYTRPFAYRWEIRPDLLRFFTNRRFYLNQDSVVSYPPQTYLWPACTSQACVLATDLMPYTFATKTAAFGMAGKQYPYEGTKFLTSLIPVYDEDTWSSPINEKLNTNFSLTNSKIKWIDYFIGGNRGPHGETYSIPQTQLGFVELERRMPHAPQTSEAFLEILEYLRKLLSTGEKSSGHQYVLDEHHPSQDLSDYRGIYTNMVRYSSGPNYPNGASMEPLQQLQIFTRMGYLPGIDDGGDWFWAYDAAYRLLMRLTSFQYVSFWEGLSQDPHLANGYKFPKHTYFVADLPMGQPSAFGSQKVDLYTDTRKDLLGFVPTYNYFSPLTEDFAPKVVTTERQLPNIYTFYSYKANATTSQLAYYKALIHLGKASSTGTEAANFQLNDYYTTIKTVAPEGSAAAPSVLDRYKKVVFGANLEILNDVKTIRDYFPYSIEINLPNVHLSEAMQQFEENGVVDHFTTLLANYSVDPAVTSSITPGIFTPRHRAVHKYILLNTPNSGKSSITLSDIQIFNLSRFMKVGTQGSLELLEHIDDHRCVKFGSIFAPNQSTEGIEPTTSAFDLYAAKFNTVFLTEFETQTYFETKTTSINADGSGGETIHVETTTTSMVGPPMLDEYIKAKALSFWDIYDGRKCHTEILVFEIVKFKINQDGKKELVQSIFIPNVSSFKDVFSYVDTQVFPNHSYTYEVFTHTLLVGNIYEILRKHNSPGEEAAKQGSDDILWYGYPPTSGEWPGWRPPEFNLTNLDSAAEDADGEPTGVRNMPMALIVRAPYYNNESLGAQNETIVTSRPPLVPDVAFYSYKGVADKVLVLLNQNFGTKTMLPIPIFPDDEDKIQKQFNAQQYDARPPGYLIYASDDYRGRWEIYRTTRQPLELTDFDKVVPRTIETRERSGYEDAILPNTDYYYMVRFVDLHENISNPTSIFYLRMVKEDGFPPYLLVKAHSVTDFHRNIITKRFKKFVKINLKDTLRTVTGKSATTAKISYDVGGSKKLNKYKFRITSLKTGKQIDINVGFTRVVHAAPLVAPNALLGDDWSEVTEAMAAKAEEALNVKVENNSDASCD